jgi:formylglycine-generating enzyme required for sulfatase activity
MLSTLITVATRAAAVRAIWLSRQLGEYREKEQVEMEAVMSVCPEMVIVPASAFTMGSPPSEPGRFDSEEQVRVTIIGPFAVAKFAVTFDQWV